MGKKHGSSVLSKIQNKIKAKGREGALLCIFLATAGGIIAMLLLMLIFAAILSSFPLPLSLFSPAGLIIGALGSLVSGFLCSLLSREKGFFFGIACGALLFVILLIVAVLCWQQKIGTYTLIKFFTMLLSGAIGGVLGVNTQ